MKLTRADEPHTKDPRYQRRVTKVKRPIEFVENMWDVEFECGHSPLLFGPGLKVGDMAFCPDCYDQRTEACG